jgi:tetratricopeptide (TPR) repeat protein
MGRRAFRGFTPASAARAQHGGARGAGGTALRALVVVAIVGSGLCLSASAISAGTMCDEGARLQQGGRMDLALDLYARAAAAGEGDCASQGLQDVGRRRGEAAAEVERGRQLEANDKPDPARAAYVHALSLDASNVDAALGLQGLLKKAAAKKGAFDEALALSRAGFEEAAATALEKAVMSADPLATVPPELTYLADDPPPLVRDLTRNLQPWLSLWPLAGQTILQLIFLIAGLVIVVALLGRLITRWFAHRIDVDDFKDAKPAGDVGSALSRVVEDELAALRREGGGEGLRLVQAPDPKVDLPSEASDLVPQAKAITALLGFLPSNVDVVKGELLPEGASGVGVSVTLVAPGSRVIGSTTVWEREFDPTWVRRQIKSTPETKESTTTDPTIREAYYKLGVAAAAWTVYALRLGRRSSRQARILTDDWRSYALFRLGVDAQVGSPPDYGRARKLYVAALAEDPTNRGALFNLGVLDVTNADGRIGVPPTPEQMTRGLSRLRLARQHLLQADRLAGVRSNEDRLWYRASYNIAATCFHRHIATPDTQMRALAREEALELVLTAARTLERLGGDAIKPADEQAGGLGRFLRTIEAAGVVLLADIGARP